MLREMFPAAEGRGPGDFELPGVELRTLNAGIAELLRREVADATVGGADANRYASSAEFTQGTCTPCAPVSIYLRRMCG